MTDSRHHLASIVEDVHRVQADEIASRRTFAAQCDPVPSDDDAHVLAILNVQMTFAEHAINMLETAHSTQHLLDYRLAQVPARRTLAAHTLHCIECANNPLGFAVCGYGRAWQHAIDVLCQVVGEFKARQRVADHRAPALRRLRAWATSNGYRTGDGYRLSVAPVMDDRSGEETGQRMVVYAMGELDGKPMEKIEDVCEAPYPEAR